MTEPLTDAEIVAQIPGNEHMTHLEVIGALCSVLRQRSTDPTYTTTVKAWQDQIHREAELVAEVAHLREGLTNIGEELDAGWECAWCNFDEDSCEDNCPRKIAQTYLASKTSDAMVKHNASIRREALLEAAGQAEGMDDDLQDAGDVAEYLRTLANEEYSSESE